MIANIWSTFVLLVIQFVLFSHGLNINVTSQTTAKSDIDISQAKGGEKDLLKRGDNSLHKLYKSDTTDEAGDEKGEHGSKPKRQRRSPNVSDSPQTGMGGATYVRWGRTTCPDDTYTELVYNGIAGGSLYTSVGAAVELICLPHEPIWGQFDAGVSGYASVYGVEYRDNFKGFDKNNLRANALSGNNMPCAVCRSSLRTSAIMIPARNECYKGWNLEYHGYLMAGNLGHVAATEYTCVDEAPETDPAGAKADDGRFLYRVEAVCGALPCPNYIAGRELTCAVCTK